MVGPGFGQAARHHVGVADRLDLLDPVLGRQAVELREDAVEKVQGFLGLELCRERREAHEVAEQDRHVLVVVGDHGLALPQAVHHGSGQHVAQQRLRPLALQFEPLGDLDVAVAQALALQGRIDPGAQQHGVERLGQEVVRPGLDGADRPVHLLHGRHHDDRQRPGGFPRPQVPQHVDAVQARHDEVEQQQVEGLGVQARERFLARRAGLHRVAVAGEAARQQVQVRHVVVHHEDAAGDGGLQDGVVEQHRPDDLRGLLHGGRIDRQLLGLRGFGGLGPHEVHHRVDLVEQASRRVEHAIKRARQGVVPVLPRFLAQHLAVAQDGGDGRAQVVADLARQVLDLAGRRCVTLALGVEQSRHDGVQLEAGGLDLVRVAAIAFQAVLARVLDQKVDEPADRVDWRLELGANEGHERLRDPVRFGVVSRRHRYLMRHSDPVAAESSRPCLGRSRPCVTCTGADECRVTGRGLPAPPSPRSSGVEVSSSRIRAWPGLASPSWSATGR